MRENFILASNSSSIEEVLDIAKKNITVSSIYTSIAMATLVFSAYVLSRFSGLYNFRGFNELSIQTVGLIALLFLSFIYTLISLAHWSRAIRHKKEALYLKRIKDHEMELI